MHLFKWLSITVLVVLFFPCAARGDGFQSNNFNSVTPGTSIRLINTGIGFHKLTWNVSGTVTTCTVALDSSVDGVTWTPGGVIGGQLCTTNGASTIVNVVSNYVRMNMTAFSGTGSVSVTWNGFVNNPGTGTVTNVSGTANQINVATPTTTPVLSLSSTLALPGTLSSATNGAASTPAATFTGTIFAGTGTTSTPLVYFNGGTAPTTWSTSGTYIGINTPNAFPATGTYLDIHNNGGASIFSISNNSQPGSVTSPSGTATFAAYTTNGVGTYHVTNRGGWNMSADGFFQMLNNAANLTRIFPVGNCIANGTAASPSVVSCGADGTGIFSCATNASGATCVVNTTAVTANSNITITQSAADGTPLTVTCNTANVLPTTAPILAAKSTGTSFTINLGTVTTNPGCFEFTITN